MLTKYMRPRDTRRESRTMAGRFRGGKLAPVMAVAFRESESGVLSQTITKELDVIAGRMITPITAEVVCVYVPALAIDAIKNPLDDYAGNAEVFRQKLLSGNPVFDLEEENEISKRLGIEPRSVAGTKYVNEAARLAYISAINYLRQRKYVNTTLLDSTAMTVTPALIGQTVLDRLNGVLDPEDRVNGKVDFAGQIPVKGIFTSGGFITTNTLKTTGGTAIENGIEVNNSVKAQEDPDNPGFPGVFADLKNAEGVSLTDFYLAERMDGLTREMRKMVDANPTHGEEIVARFAHGLSVEVGKQPFVLYQKEVKFGTSMIRAMDGASLDVTQTNTMAQHSFTVPVPPTEFGGIVITFCAVKPDETLAHQPHPILSQEWGARNYIADEMAIDPVPVTIRELYADCDVGDEETIALYVGNNHLQKMYVNYGFNRHLDTTTVEAKTAIWQIEVPMSVTPESVIYPEDLDHYPFADQTAEVCTYNIQSQVRVSTPVIFGPTPVEELAAIESENIFEDED